MDPRDWPDAPAFGLTDLPGKSLLTFPLAFTY